MVLLGVMSGEYFHDRVFVPLSAPYLGTSFSALSMTEAGGSELLQRTHRYSPLQKIYIFFEI